MLSSSRPVITWRVSTWLVCFEKDSALLVMSALVGTVYGESDYDATERSVNMFMDVHTNPLALTSAPEVVPNALTGDELMALYKNHTHGGYDDRAQYDHLRHLQSQADRDASVTVDTVGVTSFTTRLHRDLQGIRATNVDGFIRQFAEVMQREHRTFWIGIFLVFVGLVAIAFAKTN